MTFGFPAFHVEKYTAREDGADMQTAIRTALNAMSWPIREEHPGTIIASTSMNFRSWGERVTIAFLTHNTVAVTSKCALPTQCFDWGKNKENVTRFLAVLQSHV